MREICPEMVQILFQIRISRALNWKEWWNWVIRRYWTSFYNMRRKLKIHRWNTLRSRGLYLLCFWWISRIWWITRIRLKWVFRGEVEAALRWERRATRMREIPFKLLELMYLQFWSRSVFHFYQNNWAGRMRDTLTLTCLPRKYLHPRLWTESAPQAHSKLCLHRYTNQSLHPLELCNKVWKTKE